MLAVFTDPLGELGSMIFPTVWDLETNVSGALAASCAVLQQ